MSAPADESAEGNDDKGCTGAFGGAGGPLHLAALAGKRDAVAALLAEGADANLTEISRDWTPLHVAANAGYDEIVEQLLQGGAAVDPKDEDRRTPLHWAALMSHPKVVQALLKGGADVHMANMDGETAVHFAVAGESRASADLLELLLEAGASINAKEGIHGWTPLHKVVHRSLSDMAKALLERGADPTIEDDDGRTALKLLELGSSAEKAELLQLLRGELEVWSNELVLQMTLEGSGSDLTFRTLGGSVAASLTWSPERPLRELPGAVLAAMQSADFQPPFQPLRARHLRFVSPEGRKLDVGPEAPLLEQQIANLS